MDNTVLKGTLTLDENQPGGTLLSHGCQLMLKYECTIGRHAGESKIGSESFWAHREGYHEDYQAKICRQLVSVLENIIGMQETAIRRGLLSVGFSDLERSRFESCDDMHTDLLNMAQHATGLQKLDVLIDNAEGHPQSDENKRSLRDVKGQYLKYIQRAEEGAFRRPTDRINAEM